MFEPSLGKARVHADGTYDVAYADGDYEECAWRTFIKEETNQAAGSAASGSVQTGESSTGCVQHFHIGVAPSSSLMATVTAIDGVPTTTNSRLE